MEKNLITQVNKNFLEIAGYDSLESYQKEIIELPLLFQKHKGYINVNTNNKLHKVIIKKDLDDKVYIIKYNKIDDAKYIISFTDITDEERLININIKTGLPNIYAAVTKMEDYLDNNSHFVIDLVTIENINQIVKWHGKSINSNSSTFN